MIGLFTEARLRPRRVRLVSSTDAGSAAFVPLSPIALPASVIDKSMVIANVTTLKRTPIHPRHFVCAVDSRQRPPQPLIEQHGGIASNGAHRVADRPNLDSARSSCKRVIDLFLSTARCG